MTEQTLFTPTKLGEIAIANRVVMAPLTRNRAEHGIADHPADLKRQQGPGTALTCSATDTGARGSAHGHTMRTTDQAHEQGRHGH